MSLCGAAHIATAVGLAICFEAGRTEDRAATLLHWTWLEGDLALRPALRTNGVVHLAVAKALRLARVAAGLAPLWGGEVPALVELLFTVGEREDLAAIAAC